MENEILESKEYSVGWSGDLEFFVQICKVRQEGGVFLELRTLEGNGVSCIMKFNFFLRVEAVVSSKDGFEGGFVNFVEVMRFGAPELISIEHGRARMEYLLYICLFVCDELRDLHSFERLKVFLTRLSANTWLIE